MSEEWVSLTDAIEIIRRVSETDEQAQKRLTFGLGKVRYRYNAERAAAVRLELDPELNAGIDALIARHKPPGVSDAEFEDGVREWALQPLLFVKCTEFERGSLLQWNGTPSPGPMPLKWAKPADILRAARAVYADPKNNNPNKGEAEPLIRELLLAEGITAVRAQIRPVLDRKEFANRRTKIGGPKRH